MAKVVAKPEAQSTLLLSATTSASGREEPPSRHVPVCSHQQPLSGLRSPGARYPATWRAESGPSGIQVLGRAEAGRWLGTEGAQPLSEPQASQLPGWTLRNA